MHLIYWEHWKYLDTAENDVLSISGPLNFLIRTSIYTSNAMYRDDYKRYVKCE